MKETVRILIDQSTNLTIELSKDKATPEYIEKLKQRYKKPHIVVHMNGKNPDYYTSTCRTVRGNDYEG